MFKYRSQKIALLLSVIIHLVILAVYRPLSKVDIFPESEPETPVAAPIIFDLVETPDVAIRQVPEEASLVSDKNALARDEHEGKIEDGEAYSEGEVPHRVFAGDPDAGGRQQASAQSEQRLQE